MFVIEPIGRVRSSLTNREDAPKQGDEGAPDAWLEFLPQYTPGLQELEVGQEILLLTWLDRADRRTLRVYPRDDPSRNWRGVFGTRSADRPNPIGLHRVRILGIESPTRLRVDRLEALDDTPIVDVKPVLEAIGER